MKKYDVIIIGTGIAGLFTALNIEGKKILLVTKSSSNSGNSSLAQGGIVSCRNKDVHFKDTVKAGCFYNNSDAVRLIEEQSDECINKLIDYGVDFEKDNKGNLKFTREGGHSENTILYSKDTTGMEIIKCLNQKVKKRENINLVENTLVVELLKNNEKLIGIKAIDGDDKHVTYYSNTVILAAGGVGRVYKNTTNSKEITGDGIALAYGAGANIVDMEFIQFHPTAMFGYDYEKRFLISEAVRGEGAVLKNISGESFMKNYHQMKDLAPRDIVARCIFEEMKSTNADFVYLDITEKDSEYVKKRFPNIYEKCLDKGIDITKDFIRVSPAEHYIMGGIETDLNGKTNIDGLYACGECACTGVHGANRLASNSLLEGIVFGERIAQIINNRSLKLNHITSSQNIEDCKVCEDDYKQITDKLYNDDAENQLFIEIEITLRNIMTEYVSIIRNKTDLIYAIGKIEELEYMLLKDESRGKKFFELKNMIVVSKLITKAAIDRKESIGSHFILKEDEEELCVR